MEISARFSRRVFDETDDIEELCRSLEVLAKERIAKSSDAYAGFYALVEELRAAGHDLWSWDESDDFITWGGDYVRPQAQRMILHCTFAPGEPVTFEVSYGPWPKRPA